MAKKPTGKGAKPKIQLKDLKSGKSVKGGGGPASSPMASSPSSSPL